ncbi:uncharacterized protein LOC129244663 [Anastrepha obliqua]|uniref:uncharacterized protein LOC129244663 n=1 Tax=Anastrepha obliqua TaxID=95512 RepID=UPI00240A67C4|nr:uncharacterized protein LOC129244663 [Anastrepha obliqua]
MLRKYTAAVQILSRLSHKKNTCFKERKQIASKASKSTTNENSNEPVKFFGSRAATWRARDTRSGGSEDILWFQPYVISGSLAVFLLYFCILREENDIDRRLEGNLFDQVAGLEEVQLTMNYKYNKENGLDTSEIEKRLSELGIDIKQFDLQQLHKH